jgi:excinuclease ABC subunit A|tara:strand:- start:2369 stop:5149 length:2781 start_codon:yes stop_codon:yes gene_type:complete
MRKVLDLDPKSFIIIKGAQLHNLKNIDVAIPRNKMTVITGLSGSGKSSLAFDTLYAEGQRRYVESLSSYARQFMGRLNKPKVDKIIGISPAIAVEQKVNISNPRSTVGTKTEIYEYLKLLYSRIGVTYSPISGRVVKKDIVSDLIDFIKKLNNGKKLLLLAPIKKTESRTIKQRIDFLNQQGFARILVDNKIERIEPNKLPKAQFELVVDRVVINDSEEFYQRFADAVQIAFYEGNGKCSLKDLDLDKTVTFSNNFELDGIDFLNPNIHLFSFNNPYGACEKCEGYGDLVGINPELVIPDTSRSIYEEAISPWRSTGYRKFYSKLIESAINFDFPIHKPYFELTKAEKDILWNGNKFFTGIMSFFKKIEKKNYKIQNRVLLSRFRGKTICSDCKGSRLRNETNYVKVGGKSLPELIDLPIKELSIFFQKLNISKTEEKISSRILIEINSRVSVLNDLGLDYLTLNRKSNSLSGGESQRINIAVSLGSSLVGSMYILDEPSIGLHSRDNERLIKILKRLRDIGNTVIIIEHDEEIMTAADEIIDMGPEAGSFGGEIVATGSFKEILKSNTLTSKYLSGEMKIEVPKKRRKSNNWISVCGARENNLKNITAKFQIGGLTVVSGVSGSGKSTLVKDILYPALLRNFDIYTLKPGQFSSLDGDLNMIKSVEFINQNPIGRSSRSNPVTYIKAYDEIRALFANQNLSKNRNYKPKHFSFNVDGGRCDTCKGEGVVSIEMQFMADVILECDTCKGKRFKSEVREIKYNNYSIDQVLDLTIDEALNLFEFNGEKKLVRKLKPLNDVGLGYVTLGQSSTTLSGGEAQRIKLASFIAKGATKDKVLFIFDEPTTGLHFHDITKLLKSFDALLDNGHSLVVVEHNLELIKCADHMIELGPMAGKEGGQIVAQGTPEDVADVKNAPSSKYLKKKLSV